MTSKLTQRDVRALKLGVVISVAILLYVFAGPWLAEWRVIRSDLAGQRKMLKSLGAGPTGELSAAQQKLLAAVPKFEMPVSQEKQKVLFRDEFNQQIKKSGIKAKSLQYLPSRKIGQDGKYKTLRLECRARCKFNQVMDLLAKLNENPYLVGVEEIRITPDAKKRQEVDLMLVVSTFAK